MAYLDKLTIPTAVLEILAPYYEKGSNLFSLVECKQGEYLLKYADSTGKLYFEITSYTIDASDTINFFIRAKPGSNINSGERRVNIKTVVLKKYIDEWEQELGKYSRLRGPIAEDKILKQYEEEFLSEYKLIDEDGDTVGYSYQQQVKIDLFLEALNLIVEESKTEENRVVMEDIQSDIEELKEKQTSLTKNRVVNSIGKIMAKCRKYSFKLAKWSAETFLKYLAEAMVKTITEGKLPH